jgi:hypothetical protein
MSQLFNLIQFFIVKPILTLEVNILDIAALSISMNQASLSQNVSIALMKKVMESSQQNANQMIQMIQVPHPTLGKSIDLKV